MTLAAVQHILPLTTIIRQRALPVKGTVRARLHQKVAPGDIVAEAVWARDHIFLDVARTLGITGDAADKRMRCKPGEALQAGAVVAVGLGLVPKVIRAPRASKVVACGGGQILLESGETRVELRAGLSGVVTEVIPDRGVVIQTVGALIQGVWGNGRVDTGALINLADRPETVLEAARLDVSMRGSIIVAGQVKDASVFQSAAELPVRGLLIGSLLPSLLSAAREQHYPIVLTDGFGPLPMNSAAYQLITTNAKREATLNAEVFDRYTGARPEVIIPLPSDAPPPPPQDVEAFAPGQTVRLRREPAAGMVGTIVGLRQGMSLFPSGLRAEAAEVRLENGEQMLIPLVNLEVVG